MIAELTGTVCGKTKDSVVLLISGVGFEVRVSPSMLASLSEGSTVHLYTRLVVREDGWTLYGFGAREERTCFDLLHSVSGVGPKVALGVTSTMSPEEFYRVVLAQDERALTRIPGVGKKTAGRIILELRDRIGLTAKKDRDDSVLPPRDEIIEACEALEALGYSWEESRIALESVVKEGFKGDLESLLKEALKRLARA